MKILITGKNVEQVARRVKEIAEAEKIDVETEMYDGNPEKFMQPTDLIVYDLIVFLYADATVWVPEMIEGFKCRLIFPESGINGTVMRQTLRSLNRALKVRSCAQQ